MSRFKRIITVKERWKNARHIVIGAGAGLLLELIIIYVISLEYIIPQLLAVPCLVGFSVATWAKANQRSGWSAWLNGVVAVGLLGLMFFLIMSFGAPPDKQAAFIATLIGFGLTYILPGVICSALGVWMALTSHSLLYGLGGGLVLLLTFILVGILPGHPRLDTPLMILVPVVVGYLASWHMLRGVTRRRAFTEAMVAAAVAGVTTATMLISASQWQLCQGSENLSCGSNAGFIYVLYGLYVVLHFLPGAVGGMMAILVQWMTARIQTAKEPK
ncbi:MAG TPA: hypothetical protein VHO69_15605 [Phototrophicaceae bacterium]|nr:hypothetical protein [Phototrophicaceae bacterium]